MEGMGSASRSGHRRPSERIGSPGRKRRRRLLSPCIGVASLDIERWRGAAGRSEHQLFELDQPTLTASAGFVAFGCDAMLRVLGRCAAIDDIIVGTDARLKIDAHAWCVITTGVLTKGSVQNTTLHRFAPGNRLQGPADTTRHTPVLGAFVHAESANNYMQVFEMLVNFPEEETGRMPKACEVHKDSHVRQSNACLTAWVVDIEHVLQGHCPAHRRMPARYFQC